MYGAPAMAPGPVGGGVVPPVGRFHCWFAPPKQVQICSRVPLAGVLPVAAVHLPGPEFTRVFAVVAVHFCAPLPLQSQSWIGVPSAVPALVTSRHLPRAWTDPSALGVHCCAAVPLQA